MRNFAPTVSCVAIPREMEEWRGGGGVKTIDRLQTNITSYEQRRYKYHLRLFQDTTHTESMVVWVFLTQRGKI